MFVLCISRLEKEANARCAQKEHEHQQRFVHKMIEFVDLKDCLKVNGPMTHQCS